MPVPTLVTDLSTTLASNSPAGSDNVFPDLDNYLRALSGFVASIRDNSGNGWVSPYLPLTYSAGTANGVVYLNGSKVVTTGSGLVFDGTNFSTTGTASATKLIPTGGSATGNGMYLPAANTLAWSNNGSETMRLDSSGNLGIGANSPAGKLDIAGTLGNVRVNTDGNQIAFTYNDFNYITASGSGAILRIQATGASGIVTFATAGTERARITSGGDFLVGVTSVAGTGGVSFQSISGGFAVINNNLAAATGYVFNSFRRSSTEIGSVTQNGTTAVLFNTTSDRRLKDNIAPAPSASDVIDAIEIVSHDWKSAPDEHVTYGVIAQDLALVAPQAVLQGDDGDEIEKTWGVDYSKLVPMLIKEIQSLRARVAALETA